MERTLYSHLQKGGSPESFAELQSVAILIDEAAHTRGRSREQVAEFFVNLLREYQINEVNPYAVFLKELLETDNETGKENAADFMYASMQRVIIHKLRKG
jgi:hypothetical protein